MADSNSSLYFWTNKWLAEGSLRSLIAGPLRQDEGCLKIRKVRVGNNWNFSGCSFHFPPNILNLLKVVPFPLCSTCDDKIVWVSSPSGAFEAKNAYILAEGISTHQPHFARSWIWKLDSLPKIQHFFWKCLWQSIPTKEVFASCGFMGNVTCQLCNDEMESIIHLLRDCPYAKAFWERSRASNFVQNFFSLDLPSWLKINAGNKSI